MYLKRKRVQTENISDKLSNETEKNKLLMYFRNPFKKFSFTGDLVKPKIWLHPFTWCTGRTGRFLFKDLNDLAPDDYFTPTGGVEKIQTFNDLQQSKEM